jgi:hypothetical protein
MNLDELKAKLPANLQPWLGEYGPIIIAWSDTEITAWLDRLVQGDIEEAYRQILKGLNNAEFLSTGEALFLSWKQANIENKASIDLQKTAIIAALKIVLGMVVAMVGL